MSADTPARVCEAPLRIVWLADVAYVVEARHEAEYAGIVRLRKAPATRDEIDEWRFGSTTTTTKE